MKKILTLTMNPCVDVSAAVKHLAPTEKMRCSTPRRDPGGGGINVSRAVRKLGGEATACFPAGGGTGHILVEMLRRDAIDCHPITIKELNRESFAVRENSTATQYRFVLPGPVLQESEWLQCLAAVCERNPAADFLVASGSLPPGVPADFYRQLADNLLGTSTRLILDTSGAPLKEALGAGIFLIKPNRRELEEISGRSLDNRSEQEKACEELINRGACEAVALSLGSEGALFVTRDIRLRSPGLEVEMVSAVGAGDSFVAGLTLALAQGRQPEEAFLYGAAAGTAALITAGTELCGRKDTERFYRELRHRIREAAG